MRFYSRQMIRCAHAIHLTCGIIANSSKRHKKNSQILSETQLKCRQFNVIRYSFWLPDEQLQKTMAIHDVK